MNDNFLSDFEGAMPARYLRHGSQPEDIPFIKDMPQMQPFWAAGFSFSRGHFKAFNCFISTTYFIFKFRQM